MAFLVLLSTVKLWHLFRINPKMNIFTATLARAWSDMSGFLLIVGLLLVAYASAVSLDLAHNDNWMQLLSFLLNFNLFLAFCCTYS